VKMVVPSWVTDTAPITSVAASASATTITEVAVLGTGTAMSCWVAARSGTSKTTVALPGRQPRKLSNTAEPSEVRRGMPVQAMVRRQSPSRSHSSTQRPSAQAPARQSPSLRQAAPVTAAAGCSGSQWPWPPETPRGRRQVSPGPQVASPRHSSPASPSASTHVRSSQTQPSPQSMLAKQPGRQM
jgi:hypothetical protein